MKTKEAINSLATDVSLSCAESGLDANGCFNQYSGFIKGYYKAQEDMTKELYNFGKLILETFHSEGRTSSGKERLARIKYEEWFNQLDYKKACTCIAFHMTDECYKLGCKVRR